MTVNILCSIDDRRNVIKVCKDNHGAAFTSGFHIDRALSRMHTIRNLTAGLVVKSILK